MDGTGNFVAGNPDFGTMVVELRSGTPVRSWIWRAVRRRMFQADRGGGVHVDGRRLPRPRSRRSRLVGGVTPEYAELSGAGLAEPYPMTCRALSVAHGAMRFAEGSGNCCSIP